jgi:phospholipase/carboxylesterase
MSLEAISIPPTSGKKPSGLIVLLHGWGANYQDLAPLAPMFNLPDYQFLFPNAPFPHPQVPGGRAWYSLENSNYDGIEESRKLLYNWLFSLPENTGVPLEKIIVGGFSQGGAMSLDVGLKLPVAGVCSLSGYLQYEPKKPDNSFPPVLICHGKLDPVVPINLAQQAKQKLESVGVKLQYQEFDIAHEIIPQEIMLMVQFFQEVFY